MRPSRKKTSDGVLQKQAPPALIAAVLLVLLGCIGAGIFHFVNNGWQTPAQRTEWLKHNYYPLYNLEHGDRRMFDEENALRKRLGQPLLVQEKSPPVDRAALQRLMEENRRKALEGVGR